MAATNVIPAFSAVHAMCPKCQRAVDDAATAYWFKEYYQRLGQGTSPEQAYRETVLTMASRYQHPYYWAGLTLYAR